MIRPRIILIPCYRLQADGRLEQYHAATDAMRKSMRGLR
jgi:hypothetical protein